MVNPNIYLTEKANMKANKNDNLGLEEVLVKSSLFFNLLSLCRNLSKSSIRFIKMEDKRKYKLEIRIVIKSLIIINTLIREKI